MFCEYNHNKAIIILTNTCCGLLYSVCLNLIVGTEIKSVCKHIFENANQRAHNQSYNKGGSHLAIQGTDNLVEDVKQ